MSKLLNSLLSTEHFLCTVLLMIIYLCQKNVFVFIVGKGRFFRFRFPALPLLGISKQSLPQEDPDAVMVDSPRHSDGSVATRDYQLPTTRESCSPSYANDTRALIGPSHCSTPVSGPLDHSSPKGPWDRTYPDQAATQGQHQSQEDTLFAAPSIPGLTPTASRESVCSIRRASSVHDMEGFGSNSKAAFRDRHASEGRDDYKKILHQFIF